MVHICTMRHIICLLLAICFSNFESDAQAGFYSDSLTVYIFMGEDCRICQYYSNELRQIHKDFASDQISFVGLFPNRYSTDENIALYQAKYDIPFQLKREYFQTKAKKFNVKVTPEVVLYDEKREKIVYQGRIDDSYVSVGKRRQIIRNKELKEALQSIVSNKEIKTKETVSIGCFVNFVSME